MNNRLIKTLVITTSLSLSLVHLHAQDHEIMSAPEMYSALKHLERGSRVLYIAAHPDDENTRLIAWLENEQHVETSYLSLTRGEGGQNLIGEEQGDALGVIRTYELLEARKIDGGEQFFTRAVDFGYSKSAEESFRFWGKEEILRDMVYVIRKVRPHYLITRFPPNRNAGHGHHEASAILAAEAFDLAADPNAFPELNALVEPWQPAALYHNTSSWWRKELDEKDEATLWSEKIARINVGTYDPVIGLSATEVASYARSKHQCQAFGTARARGVQYEYLQHVKGTWNTDPFSAIPSFWDANPEMRDAFKSALEGFDFFDMNHNLALLHQHVIPRISARNMWADAPDMHYVTSLVHRIQQSMLGVRIEIFAGADPVVVGRRFPITVQVYNAGTDPVEVRFSDAVIDTSVSVAAGVQVEWKATWQADTQPNIPYWLRSPHGWLYEIGDIAWLGLPMLPGPSVAYSIKSEKAMTMGSTTIHRKWTDRSIGELEQPLAFVPLFSISTSPELFISTHSRKVRSRFEFSPFVAVKGDVQFQPYLNAGFYFNYSQPWVTDLAANQKTVITHESTDRSFDMKFRIVYRDTICDQEVQLLQYPHIPEVVLMRPVATRVLNLDIAKPKGRILYVEGSGDRVDEALMAMGYEVDHIPLSELGRKDVKAYKAIVLGIRAFNTNEECAAEFPHLMKYVERGGVLIVQYNTTYDLKVEQVGPYPLQIGRERVTEEDAPVTFLLPEHRVLNKPNKITTADFDGWVQERGLYFAQSWDSLYTPVLSWQDSGEEKPLEGALLVAPYGKGAYFYTGISFFRELPAGVPGAYRLIQNMIEYKP